MKKVSCFVTMLFAVAVMAQDTQSPHKDLYVGVKGMIWNQETMTLSWMAAVQSEDDIKNKEKKLTFEKYEINFSQRSMKKGKETRYFSRHEALTVIRELNEIVGGYAGKSTLWWIDGHGSPTPEEVPEPNDSPLPKQARMQ